MISVENRQPVRARSARRPADFPTADAYSFTLTATHLAAFDRALAANRDGGRDAEDLTARDFPLESIAGDVAAWRDEVLRGRGFIVLRELPRDRYAPDDLGMLFFGLDTHFGRAVSQSSLGDRLGHVVDVGGKDRCEHTLLHNRTSFEDDGCAGRQRHPLRLWLMLDGLRPLTPDVHACKGTTGILGHEGSSTYYRGHAI